MVTLLLDRPFDDAEFNGAAELDLRNIGPKVWPRVLAGCRSKALRLYHVTLPSLEGIERLDSVEDLAIEWVPKLTDLSPVFKLRGLTSLSVFDVPKVRHLDGIEELTGLTSLKLSGNRGSLTPKMQLSTLEPVTRIPGLTRFSLTNARLDDDDITVLARCSKLEHLHLSSQFERGQRAFLAKRLNHQLAEPITAGFGTNIECSKCHGGKFIFSGRRMPILCPSCDRARYEKHLAEFERLVQDA